MNAGPSNSSIARALLDLADAMEMTGGADAAFKVKALRGGAKAIEAMPDLAAERLAAGTLTGVAGIGAGIARRVEELVKTGKIADLEAARTRLSPGLFEIARVEGIGPKTALLIHEALGVNSLDELEAAAKAHRIQELPRMGAKKEEQILAAVARARTSRGRIRLDRAEKEARPVVERLLAVPGVLRVEMAGSLRRRRATRGGGGKQVSSKFAGVSADADTTPIMDAFVTMASVEAILARGPTKSSVKTRLGLQLDVRVVPPESFGAALHYVTGSKEHNVAVRALAVKRGILINEYGVFDDRGGGKRIGGAEELDVFRAVGLPFIPPELRENTGEIELGLADNLPHLITIADLRGDLHMHTHETDGKHSIEQMAAAALALGRDYIAITEHSQNLKIARGVDSDRLAAQGRAIAALNETLGGKPRVLRGIEADILVDGTMDLGAETLGTLDWVIGSVHSHFQLPRDEQTRRMIRAMESGLIDVVGHPTGRLIEERPPYDVDMEALVDAAARTGVALEINAYPERRDLNDEHARLARDRGAFMVIDTDSHAAEHLRGIGNGVDVARRAGLEPRHVLNTRSVEGLLEHRRQRKS